MAQIIDGKIILEKEELNLLAGITNLELVPNQKGIFLLIDKQIAIQKEGAQVCVNLPLIEEHEEVIGLIKKSKISELVEGKFEESLNEKQKEALLELIINKKVFVFKLNNSYKKGIYRISEEIREKKDSEEFNTEKKALPDYTIEIDGFISTNNTERARSLSIDYKEQIEKNELKGIKNFEGVYYLIETKLIDKYLEKILNDIRKNKEISLEEIAKQENISIELTKIIIEFLKDEGEILEKRKGYYKFIE
ncbi:MAG: hypothetical protein PHX27_03245 [Candidatus ainarchaeum sp.]|nr:hypothetical protein [Candidatus ainarchaeum sp.]